VGTAQVAPGAEEESGCAPSTEESSSRCSARPIGLHFRDAMEDGYYLGHTVADLVIDAVR
jgi:hypothetical protein